MDSSDLDPNLIHGYLGPPESARKWHLDRLSRFAGLTNVTKRHTDRPTTLLRL